MGPATGAPRTEIPHVPALDGLRGLAVLAILLFHAERLPGGWLGVDLFFVLSGFLITSLLLAEHAATGAISLRAFWARRARRLLPALFVLLIGVAAYAVWLAAPSELARIRADGLATLLYVANWHALFAGHDYWAIFAAPSPLDHAWSLAIEEQFYLVWPPVVLLVLYRGRGSAFALGTVAGVLALASAAWMVWLFDELQGTARVYFGTDTRVAATLVGAVVACRLRERLGGPAGRWSAGADVSALAALIGLAVAAGRLDGNDPFVYRGGLFAMSLLSAVVIAGAVSAPDGATARLLALRPLRLLGLISYGVYLWHWPIYLAMTPERTGLDGLALDAARIAASLAAATLSYLAVERPIRRGAIPPARRLAAAVGGASAAALALVLATWDAAPATRAAGSDAVADLGAGPVDVVLLGDSMAEALGEAFVGRAAARGLRALALGRYGCTLLPAQAVRLESGGSISLQFCRRVRWDWEQAVARARPGLVLVVEGTTGIGTRIERSWTQPCEPTYDDALDSALSAALETFASAGADVVMTTSIAPELADLSPETRGLLLRPEVRDDATAARLFAEVAACQNAVRRRAAARTGARLLELGELVCPAGQCRGEVEGARLRADGVHFLGPGADYAADWLLDRLQAMRALPSD